MIVALTGYARTGKDTVGTTLVRDHGFRRVAFGDLLKQIAEDTNPIISVNHNDPDSEPFDCSVRTALRSCGNWENVKDDLPEMRQYLVDLGNSLRARIPNVETSWWLDDHDPSDRVVNTNVYHPEEIDRIRAAGGYVVRIHRPSQGPANEDEARTGRHPVDYTLTNDGTREELSARVHALFRMLTGIEKPGERVLDTRIMGETQ